MGDISENSVSEDVKLFKEQRRFFETHPFFQDDVESRIFEKPSESKEEIAAQFFARLTGMPVSQKQQEPVYDKELLKTDIALHRLVEDKKMCVVGRSRFDARWASQKEQKSTSYENRLRFGYEPGQQGYEEIEHRKRELEQEISQASEPYTPSRTDNEITQNHAVIKNHIKQVIVWRENKPDDASEYTYSYQDYERNYLAAEAQEKRFDEFVATVPEMVLKGWKEANTPSVFKKFDIF